MTPDTAHICSKGTRLSPTVSRSVPVLLTPEHLASQVFVLIVVQSLSRVQLFATSWTAAHQASMSFAISQSLLKLMSIESMMPFNHLILRHPLLLLPSIFPSIRVFSKMSVLRIRWQNY